MERRLYYEDPQLRRFSARVLEITPSGERTAIRLDRTAFYPTSGGQPHDVGYLNDLPVVEVVEREADGAVLHILAKASSGLQPGDEVEGVIDWPRRFDHMQQHTGQHILSAAAVETLGAETVSFHLGAEVSTIDLNRAPLTMADLEATERRANEVVFANLPVLTRWVSPAEAAALPLRKPPTVSGPIRVVEVSGFDWSACGGTHVQTAGQVGLIKVLRVERRGQESRVTFVCGWRALSDYSRRLSWLQGLMARLTVGADELISAVDRLIEESKTLRKAYLAAQEASLELEARMLAAEAQSQGRWRVVCRSFASRDIQEVKWLAQQLAQQGCVALLATGGAQPQLVFARPEDEVHSALDMAALVRSSARLIGGGGGGRPALAQGGGRDASQVEAALKWAQDSLPL